MGNKGTGIAHLPLPGKAPRNCNKCGILFATYKCNVCTNAKAAAWREKNREYMLEQRAKNAAKQNQLSREYYSENRAVILEKSRLRRIANPEQVRAYATKNKALILARAKAYRVANPEKVKARQRSWRARNTEHMAEYVARTREAIRERQRQRRARNPGLSSVSNNNRRARVLKVGGKLSHGIREKLFSLQKGKCACCGESLGRDCHLDHITPISRGGANEDWNIQLLRKRCNLQKRTKDPIDFMQQRGFLI